MELKLCFIKKEYFEKHSSFVKMLDTENVDKQSKRTHLCIMVCQDANHYYIPLRNHLGAEIRKYGRIGHAVPSEKRESAGLDYRYALIVNEDTYIEWQTEKRIPKSQYRKIEKDYDVIQAEFAVYLNGFIRAVKKKRYEREPLYRESSLVNFISELNI
ncbi:MAG: hypothetical protein NC409_03175 [Clostridium sp.]|nr:hypothetical protein [Clostridium sp.]